MIGTRSRSTPEELLRLATDASSPEDCALLVSAAQAEALIRIGAILATIAGHLAVLADRYMPPLEQDER